jgi:hypothetical protein
VADLYLSFRMQECRPPSLQDVEMILPSMGHGISLICLRSLNPTIPWSFGRKGSFMLGIYLLYLIRGPYLLIVVRNRKGR